MGFTFFESYYEAIEKVDDPKVKLALYEAICAYAIKDEEIPLEGVADAMFALIKPTLDHSKAKSESGRKGGLAKQSKSEANAKQTASKTEANRKQNESKSEANAKREGEGVGVGVGEKKKRVGRFAPPSLDDVREYCAERQNKVDPEAFVAFYESNGWKVGKNSMKDWKAAVRTWEQRDKREQPRVRSGTPGRFGFKEQRKYDMEQLERQLLTRGARA